MIKDLKFFGALFRMLVVLGIIGICLNITRKLGEDYVLGVNVSNSLPWHIFLIEKNTKVKRGDYVAFHSLKNSILDGKVILIKKIVGVAGDRVEEKRRHYYINDQDYGFSHELTQKGTALHLGPTGIIPFEKYYVSAPNPLSFDSRYAELGWIGESQMIGKAYPLV